MRCTLIVLAIALVGIAAQAQSSAAQPPRAVILFLPQGITGPAQISYFTVGEFGGRDGGVTTIKDRTSYSIDTYIDGVPASEIKIVAYLPGCDFILWDIPLHRESESRQLCCTLRASLPFRGEIFPISITREQPTVIEVGYLAGWANRFFEVKDGPVPNFRIATIHPDKNGQFQLEVPTYSSINRPAMGSSSSPRSQKLEHHRVSEAC